MARIVKRTATEPARYLIDGKEQWLCRCGLSKNQPFCDGSHKLTRGEEPSKLYWYDDAGVRHEAAGEFPDIRSLGERSRESRSRRRSGPARQPQLPH